jgi:hypothetical protein
MIVDFSGVPDWQRTYTQTEVDNLVEERVRASAMHVPKVESEGQYECNSHWIECSCGWNLKDALDQGSEPINWTDHILAALRAKRAPDATRGEK